jgi:hypothetical protein
MEYDERKAKDAIREGILLVNEAHVKKSENPYSALTEINHEKLNEACNIIYDHMKMRGVLK